jgi:pimeloyl-ACP methyl ester carboxylesterase
MAKQIKGSAMTDEQATAHGLGRRDILGLAGGAAMMMALPQTGKAATAAAASASKLRQGVFTVDADDLRIHCEVRGAGPLIIMLNGMWLRSFTDHFGAKFMTALARHFTVLTFDPRGQGRTTLGAGPITYGRFATDTVALMKALNIQDAHFIGHSDGGVIQLDLLTDYPERVRSATLIGTSYSQDSYSPKVQETFTGWFEAMRKGEAMALTPDVLASKTYYEGISPQPDKAIAVMTANRECWATEPNVSLRALGRVKKPVLVFEAGKDASMPPENFRRIAQSIPGSRTVTYPDMTHDITPYVDRIAEETAQFIKGQAG